MHYSSDILTLVLCGYLADCSGFSEVEDYGKDKIDFLRSDLGLKLEHGIPSEDTMNRVFRHLEPSELEKSLRSCCQEIIECVQGKHLCIDGKTLRSTIKYKENSSQIQLVSVWLSAEKVSFYQVQIESKTNEIKAIPELLDAIECESSTITIDAIASQRDITKKIIEKKADYLIGLKSNQGYLFEQVSDWLRSRKTSLPTFIEIDKDHGRAEIRSTYM